MAESRHRSRRRFGQNFLIDPGIISRIVETLAPKESDRLLEIGPGHGALTGPVLTRAGRLIALEIDRDLAAQTEQRFGHLGELRVITADALNFDFSQVGDHLRVFGNLPYNISTPLLFHLLHHRKSIADMLFMLQKEVVDRLAAQPGTKAYGRLTVTIGTYCEVEGLFKVPPAAFRPAPKIDSRMVRLCPKQPEGDAPPRADALDRITRAAFSARRKTLRNAFKGLLEVDQLAQADIDPTRRPDSLTVSEFGVLSRLISALPAD